MSLENDHIRMDFNPSGMTNLRDKSAAPWLELARSALLQTDQPQLPEDQDAPPGRAFCRFRILKP